MSKKQDRDYLYLIWKSPETRSNYTVGELSKNGLYEFEYGHEIEKAIKEGFQLLTSFNDINNKYVSEVLFPVFSSRLPDKKRRDIDEILAKYGLKEYDEYKLLKKSGARLPIDTIELIDPIFEDEEVIERTFYLAGPKHYIGCDGEFCDKSLDLAVDDLLELGREPDNKFDGFAVKMFSTTGEHVGYIPRYYSKSVSEAMERGVEFVCTVKEFNKENNCNECIKIHMKGVQ